MAPFGGGFPGEKSGAVGWGRDGNPAARGRHRRKSNSKPYNQWTWEGARCRGNLISPVAKSRVSSFFCTWQELLSAQDYLRKKDRVWHSFIEVSAHFQTGTTLSPTKCDSLTGMCPLEARSR